jgi:hypothetical protein
MFPYQNSVCTYYRILITHPTHSNNLGFTVLATMNHRHKSQRSSLCNILNCSFRFTSLFLCPYIFLTNFLLDTRFIFPSKQEPKFPPSLPEKIKGPDKLLSHGLWGVAFSGTKTVGRWSLLSRLRYIDLDYFSPHIFMAFTLFSLLNFAYS